MSKILYNRRDNKFFIEGYWNKRTHLCPRNILILPTIFWYQDTLGRPEFKSLQFGWLFWTITFNWS